MSGRQAKKKRTERREVARRILANDPGISGEALMKEMRRRDVPVSRSYAYSLADELRGEVAAEQSEAERRQAAQPHLGALRREMWRYAGLPSNVAILLAIALDGARYSGDPTAETPPLGVTPPAEGEPEGERYKAEFLSLLDAIAAGRHAKADGAMCKLVIPVTGPRERLPSTLRAFARPVEAPSVPTATTDMKWPDEIVEPHRAFDDED